jgi:16S rRNA (guanine527-N7)-methyltransferase
MSESLPDQCRATLTRGIEQLDLELSVDKTTRLLQYLALLDKWNKKFNLTAVRDPRDMVIRHLLDSLATLPYLDNKSIIDVGTGAGLPGLVIAICKPELGITLLDTNGKKTRFLQQVVMEMQLNNVSVVQSRVESYSPEHLFDRIISRAFTALDNMVDWCQHFLAPHGEFLAMKGAYPEPGQKPLPSPWQVKETITLNVPYLDEQRHLVRITRR